MSSFESIKPLYFAPEAGACNFIEAARLNFERSTERPKTVTRAKAAKKPKKIDWAAQVQQIIAQMEEK